MESHHERRRCGREVLLYDEENSSRGMAYYDKWLAFIHLNYTAF